MIATSAQRDIAAAEDRAYRLEVLCRRSDDVLARLVINAEGDDVAIELPTTVGPKHAPQSRKERRFARALRRVIGN